MRQITQLDVGKTLTLKDTKGNSFTGLLTEVTSDGRFASIGGRNLPISEWQVSSSSDGSLLKSESNDSSGELLLEKNA